VNGKTTNVTSSTVNGKDVNATASDTVTLSSATVTASNKATVKSTNQMLIKNSTVNGNSAVLAESTKGKAFVQKSKLNSSKGSVTVKSDVSTAQVYDSSAIKAATTANINGKTANVLNSNAEAKNINVTGSKNTEVLSSKLTADDKIVLNSTSDRTYVKGSTLTSKNSNVQVKSSKNTYVYDSTVKGKSKTAIAGQTTDVRNSTIDGTKIKSKQTK
ncbi:MAG: hypothetical protein IKR34_07375, partial [Candidatus Gastranaerophilales bacterium]|nr:hypothetical protein [Candidatus Gastranaerophilales bacterium]